MNLFYTPMLKYCYERALLNSTPTLTPHHSTPLMVTQHLPPIVFSHSSKPTTTHQMECPSYSHLKCPKHSYLPPNNVLPTPTYSKNFTPNLRYHKPSQALSAHAVEAPHLPSHMTLWLCDLLRSQTKKIISALFQSLWLPNLVGWWY